MSFTIYPAIDLRRGKVVRLKEGDLNRMPACSDDPIEATRKWLNMGATWLHFVNLDGVFGENDDANRSAPKSILKLGAQVQFGDGMRSLDAIENSVDLGVNRIVLGTIAIDQLAVVANALKKFGAEKIAERNIHSILYAFWKRS